MIRLLVIFLSLCLDIVWWRAIDQKLRRLKHAALWRSLLAAFIAPLALWALWLAAFPFKTVRDNDLIPMFLPSAAYLWHILVLPMSLIVMMLVALVTRIQ